MKKLLFTCLAYFCTWALVSCGKYAGSFTTTQMSRTQRDDHCELKFASLSGRMVLQSKKTQDGNEGAIRYYGKLKSGEINVYYDTGRMPEKQPLFHLTAGKPLKASGGYIEQGERVYIIIETVGKVTGGEIRIDLD